MVRDRFPCLSRSIGVVLSLRRVVPPRQMGLHERATVQSVPLRLQPSGVTDPRVPEVKCEFEEMFQKGPVTRPRGPLGDSSRSLMCPDLRTDGVRCPEETRSLTVKRWVRREVPSFQDHPVSNWNRPGTHLSVLPVYFRVFPCLWKN